LAFVPEPQSSAVTDPASAYADGRSVVYDWVAAISLSAFSAPDRIDAAREQVAGAGWYRVWLRYVIDLSVAEAQALTDPESAESRMVAAFGELASEANPFAGTPRACDLSSLTRVIADSIARGLTLLRSEAAWEEVTQVLTEVSQNTTTYLDRAANGPLQSEMLAELLLPYAVHPAAGEVVASLLKEQAERLDDQGELYQVHTTHQMLLARCSAAVYRADDARKHWDLAARMLGAYGVRKERSLFEALDSLPALGSVGSARARAAASRVQPLTEAVLQHTDGRETQYAPNAWFTALCRINPIGAVALLTRSLVRDGGRIS
jgi:hypothetical protein